MSTNTVIGDAVARVVSERPETSIVLHSAAVIAEITLAELWDEARRYARGLQDLGIGAGDVVMLQLPNSREGFAMHAATWLRGAVVLPVIPIYGPAELGFIARQSGAVLFVGTPAWRSRSNAEVFEEVGASVAHRFVLGAGLEKPEIPELAALRHDDLDGLEKVTVDPDDRALLVYTSGTTADPKGVQHTHRTLLAEVESLNELRGGGPEVTSLAAFPSGHIAGVLGVLRLLTRGTTTVTMEAWDPLAGAQLIARYGIQASGGAPIYLSGLLDVAEEHGIDLSSLDEYTTGAANVSPTLIHRAERAGIRAFRCYGSSEHPTISSSSVDDPLEKRSTTDGRIAPGTEVRIVDDAGSDLPVGADGEILTRGPELFIGYTDDALNAESFTDGWFRTGDIGRLDADGFLTITDRKKDIIVRGGENISSKEIEDALLAHPAVAEVAAVGAPDQAYGERVCVFVVLKAGRALDLAEVQQHFATRGLAKQKTPERLEIATELPRTVSGKIRKPELRLLLQRAVGG